MQESEVSAGANGAEVKGWRNGLLLILPSDGTWEQVIEQVHERLDEAKARSFWRGAQTTIDCGSRTITLEELEALQNRIRGGFGLVPVAVISTNSETRANAEKIALTIYDELPAVRKPSPQPTPREAERESEPASSASSVASQIAPGGATVNNALYVPQTVRSGQRIVHEGHLIVCGDVNAGAEVVAGGDILVLGALRGVAHAGCYGDENARIVANSLRPPQLRIAGKIARSPEEQSRSGGSGNKAPAPAITPEAARILNGEIQVFPL